VDSGNLSCFLPAHPAATTEINITGDNWVQVLHAATYVDAVASLPLPGVRVEAPKGIATYGTRAYLGRKQVTPAGTTADSSISLPHGVAPTTPVNGDMWTTTAGLYVRINGVTVGPLT